MNVEIMYATHCEATVSLLDGSSWTYNNHFHTLKEALEWAQEQIDGQSQFDHINNIIIVDADTGEVLAECTPDVDPYEDWDDWNYNEDMGYDPYMGCYTDDC